jgi:TetR/AcrR family transcriptional regulator, cholesterol catabolism regulator
MSRSLTSTDSKAARTRARILRAAASEIARRGYGGASLRLIAERAGLQLGSLYFHFSSKDDLVVEVLRDGIDTALEHVSDAVQELAPDTPGARRLKVAMHAHLTALHASHDRGAAVVWMTETMPSNVRRRKRQHERRYSRWWRDLIIELQRSGDVRSDITADVLRDIVIAALNATLSRPSTGRSSDHDRLVHALGNMLGSVGPE